MITVNDLTPAQIIELRRRHHWRQWEPARELGVSTRAVGRWETGEHTPLPPSRRAILKMLRESET